MAGSAVISISPVAAVTCIPTLGSEAVSFFDTLPGDESVERESLAISDEMRRSSAAKSILSLLLTNNLPLQSAAAMAV
jgi:hypothetical protein